MQILGVNRDDLADGNPGMVAGRTLPWLQDTTSQDVWDSWKVTWRDVVVLDSRNVKLTVYNLTDHDLEDSTAFNTLKQILLTAAR